MVSAVRADATEVHMPNTKSSSTNGLTARGRKVHQKIFFRKKNPSAPLTRENMLNPLVKSVFKSVDN